MLKKSYCFSALALISVLLITSSGYSQEDKTLPKIGILSPLSGSFASIGVDVKQGIDIALEEIQQPLPAEFIYADSRAESAQAVTEFNRLLNLDKIVAALPIRGPVGMAINPISFSRKIPILGAVANKKFTLENPYAFQFWADSEAEADYLVATFQKLKANSIAVLTAIDDYPMAVSEAVIRIAKQKNINVVKSLEFNPTETDFSSAAISLNKLNPDVIFVNVSIAQIASMIKQLRQMNIKSKIVNNFWVSKSEVLTALGKEANDIYYMEMSTDYPNLQQSCQKKFNNNPSAMTVSIYLSVYMLHQALLSLKGHDVNAENLYSELTKISEIQTPNGTFSIKNRQVQFPLTLMKLVNGSIQKAEPGNRP